MTKENKHTKLIEELLQHTPSDNIPDGITEAMLNDAQEGLDQLDTKTIQAASHRINKKLQEQILLNQSAKKTIRPKAISFKNWVTITILAVLIIIAITYIFHILPH